MFTATENMVNPIDHSRYLEFVAGLSPDRRDNEREFGELDAVAGSDFAYSLARGFEIRSSPPGHADRNYTVGVPEMGRPGALQTVAHLVALWGHAVLRRPPRSRLGAT